MASNTDLPSAIECTTGPFLSMMFLTVAIARSFPPESPSDRHVLADDLPLKVAPSTPHFPTTEGPRIQKAHWSVSPVALSSGLNSRSYPALDTGAELDAKSSSPRPLLGRK